MSTRNLDTDKHICPDCKRLEEELDAALKQASMWETTSLCQAAEIDRLQRELDSAFRWRERVG